MSQAPRKASWDGRDMKSRLRGDQRGAPPRSDDSLRPRPCEAHPRAQRSSRAQQLLRHDCRESAPASACVQGRSAGWPPAPAPLLSSPTVHASSGLRARTAPCSPLSSGVALTGSRRGPAHIPPARPTSTSGWPRRDYKRPTAAVHVETGRRTEAPGAERVRVRRGRSFHFARRRVLCVDGGDGRMST